MKVEPKTPYLANKKNWALDLTFVKKKIIGMQDQLSPPLEESEMYSPTVLSMNKSGEFSPPALNSPPSASLRFTR